MTDLGINGSFCVLFLLAFLVQYIYIYISFLLVKVIARVLKYSLGGVFCEFGSFQILALI